MTRQSSADCRGVGLSWKRGPAGHAASDPPAGVGTDEAKPRTEPKTAAGTAGVGPLSASDPRPHARRSAGWVGRGDASSTELAGREPELRTARERRAAPAAARMAADVVRVAPCHPGAEPPLPRHSAGPSGTRRYLAPGRRLRQADRRGRPVGADARSSRARVLPPGRARLGRAHGLCPRGGPSGSRAPAGHSRRRDPGRRRRRLLAGRPPLASPTAST